jgi:hypothetical protein
LAITSSCESRIEEDDTLDRKRILAGQILDDLASLATSMPADRSRDLTEDLEKVLFGLFMDTKISLDELRVELTRRIQRLQIGRPQLSLIQGGAC